MDEENAKVYEIYSLVSNQVRMTSMGDVIGLDYGVVLDVIKLYASDCDIKKIFEDVLKCFQIEQEFKSIKAGL